MSLRNAGMSGQLSKAICFTILLFPVPDMPANNKNGFVRMAGKYAFVKVSNVMYFSYLLSVFTSLDSAYAFILDARTELLSFESEKV